MNNFEVATPRQAIQAVIDGCLAQSDVSNTTPKSIARLRTEALYSLRMNKTKLKQFEFVIAISIEIARRELVTFDSQRDLKCFKKAIFAISDLLRACSTTKGQACVSGARSMISELTIGLAPLPTYLDGFIKNCAASAKPVVVQKLTGLDTGEWEQILKLIHGEAEHVSKSLVERFTEFSAGDVQIQLNSAETLASLDESSEFNAENLPVYDQRDSSIKLREVRIKGFRGSPQESIVDFTTRGVPSSMLLWGDNGVGKSTIIDGIEFALQGRIDRSADFNSSLRPTVRNITTPAATASILLSDGSSVERSLELNGTGRDVASAEKTRPGFRIAPVVIRRSDILRFLDTETLSRSMIFFDYFPDADGPLGVRPDEHLRMLEEERFTLLILRDSLAQDIKRLRPNTKLDIRDRSQLENFMRVELQSSGNERATEIDGALSEDIGTLVASLQQVQGRLAKIKKTLDKGVENLNPVAYRSQLSRIVPVLHSVMDDLTKSFHQLTSADHIKKIQVRVAKSGPISLDILLEFTNGKKAFPQQVFSEAYKDLMALLFFLAVTKKAAEHGQAKVLILDDVLQSVDSTVRVEVMNFVLEEFKGWQLIISGHDRAWLNQLRSLFQSRGVPVIERHITKWTFSGGLEVSNSGWSTVSSLENAIERADHLATASATGLLLEHICQELSWRLGISIIRRKEDRYTLNDLWGGVSKVLKKSEGAASPVEEITKLLSLRNLLGAHYNEWAAAIPWRDIQTLAQSAIDLHHAVCCSDCNTWVATLTNKRNECRCGKLSV